MTLEEQIEALRRDETFDYYHSDADIYSAQGWNEALDAVLSLLAAERSRQAHDAFHPLPADTGRRAI